MKKSTQMELNNSIITEMNIATEELIRWGMENPKRLRSCSAYVYETKNYYFLESYNTIVAFIDKSTDTCYDILRLVYGYTATSAQHIAKFRHDYGSGKWGCEHEMRYYDI